LYACYINSEYEGTQTANPLWSCKWVSFKTKEVFPLENWTFHICQVCLHSTLKNCNFTSIKLLNHQDFVLGQHPEAYSTAKALQVLCI